MPRAPLAAAALALHLALSASAAPPPPSAATPAAPGPASVTAGPDYAKLASQSSRLTPDAARQLEAKLKANPDDLSARIQLLGYYYIAQSRSPDLRAVRQAHILWLIEHHPEVGVPGPYVALLPRADGDAYDRGRALWLQHTAHAKDLAVVDHAASYLLMSDRATAEQLWRQAETADPDNSYWPERLAALYALDARDDTPEGQAAAARALEALERAQGSAKDLFNNLDALAKMAFLAGDMTKANRYARTLVGAAVTHEGEWNYGNAIHNGNMILGRIAVRAGDLDGAKYYLKAAGETPGSPQLNSMGPNVSLARDLAEKGETAAVVAYFKACATFWKSGRAKLDQWANAVTNGELPDFGANLTY